MNMRCASSIVLTGFVMGILLMTGGCLGLVFGTMSEIDADPYGAGCEDPTSEFNCGDNYGGCISGLQACDGTPDCSDGYDESDEVCAIYG